MPKCGFNKVACNFIEIALRYGCSPVHFLHFFRTPFYSNTSGRLLLNRQYYNCRENICAQRMMVIVWGRNFPKAMRDYFSRPDYFDSNSKIS